MGADINMFAERQRGDQWEFVAGVSPFGYRSYGIVGFLADVRNYSAVKPIDAPRGLPKDASPEARDHLEDCYACTWLSTAELLAYDFDQIIEDRRVMRDGNGGCTCEPGEGQTMPLREFLGLGFFEDLERLRASGAQRIVFGFDS